MLIYNDQTEPMFIESIHTPLDSTHMWVLDVELYDYTLAPILMLEEIYSPAITLDVLGFQFTLPSNWFVVVYDLETTQLDVVQISELTGQVHTILGGGPNITRAVPIYATPVDYKPLFKHVGPSLNKHQLLCHPVAPGYWINVSPIDTYSKYLKESIVGDLC
jgi:hypothetical protein